MNKQRFCEAEGQFISLVAEITFHSNQTVFFSLSLCNSKSEYQATKMNNSLCRKCVGSIK